MKTRTVNVYEYKELSDSAKETARRNHEIACGYAWGDDALESLKALAVHFGGHLASIAWDGGSYSSAKFDMPELSKKEIAALLKELGSYNRRTLKGLGDCKLTGYYADESAIDGFRVAFKRQGITDLDELMQAAFDSWLKAAQSDYEYQYSDEGFADLCEANGYLFFADGELA